MGLGDWTSTWQANASDASTISTTDDFLNETKLYTQERGVIEHDWGTSSLGSGLTDGGRHKPGSARAFYQDATPQRLRQFDNTLEDAASWAVLDSDDGGRLWVETDNNNKLWVYDGAGVWEEVGATPSWPSSINVSSVDNTTISDSSYTALTGFPSALDIVTPAEGTWQCFIHVRVPVTNASGSANRLCRVELQRDGTHADGDEQTVHSDQGDGDGYRTFNLMSSFTAVAGTTYTFTIRAQASGANVAYGGGAMLTGGDTVNRWHRVIAHLYPTG